MGYARVATWFDADGNRFCGGCKTFQAASCFHKDKKGPAGLSHRCKECTRLYARNYYAADSEERRRRNMNTIKQYLRRQYGLTKEQYDAKLAAQNYMCAICCTSEPAGGWHLDHNHSTGAVRDFLCGSCNRGLGLMREDIGTLLGAIAYVTKHTDNACSQKEVVHP